MLKHECTQIINATKNRECTNENVDIERGEKKQTKAKEDYQKEVIRTRNRNNEKNNIEILNTKKKKKQMNKKIKAQDRKKKQEMKSNENRNGAINKTIQIVIKIKR